MRGEAEHTGLGGSFTSKGKVKDISIIKHHNRIGDGII